jgi:integrase
MINGRGMGSVYESRGVWFVSLSLGSRISIRLSTCHCRPDAEVRRAILADIGRRLKRSGDIDIAQRICRKAAEVPDAELPRILALVDGLIRGRETIARVVEASSPAPARTLTFGEFSRQWTSNALAKQFRKRVRRIEHTENILRLKKHVYPVVYLERKIEDTPLNEFTREHAEHVLQQPTLSEGSMRHVAQCIHRVLALAVYPVGILTHSPLQRGWLPLPDPVKARSYLFPEEDAAVMSNVAVALVRRLFLGVCAREGGRKTNIVELQWADLNLGTGTRGASATVDGTKNGEHLHWVLDPGTAEALRRWKTICPSQIWIFPAEAVPRHRRARRGSPMAVGNIAVHLRNALEGADVERREQLYRRTALRLRLRAHDLRATFITLALAQGRSEDWVRTRTGHRTSQMIARYRLEAKTAQELELGWLHPLHEVIPELAGLGPKEPSPDHELSANCRRPRESAPDASGATLH